MTYIKIATALAAAVGVLQAGVVNLPIDDFTKSILALALGVVATFFSVLLMEDKPV